MAERIVAALAIGEPAEYLFMDDGKEIKLGKLAPAAAMTALAAGYIIARKQYAPTLKNEIPDGYRNLNDEEVVELKAEYTRLAA